MKLHKVVYNLLWRTQTNSQQCTILVPVSRVFLLYKFIIFPLKSTNDCSMQSKETAAIKLENNNEIKHTVDRISYNGPAGIMLLFIFKLSINSNIAGLP